MANTDFAFGLRPVRYSDGRPYTGGGMRAVATDTSTALAIGDPVTFTGAGSTLVGANKAPLVKRAAAAGPIDGVIVGILSDAGAAGLTRDFARTIPADTTGANAAQVLIVTDPSLIYQIQEDSVTENVVLSEYGLHANITQTGPDAVNGISKVELDSNTAAADSTGGLAVQIVGLADIVNNDTGANSVLEVRINKTNQRSFGSSR